MTTHSSHGSNADGQAAPISRPETDQPGVLPNPTRSARQLKSNTPESKSESVGDTVPRSEQAMQDAWYCKADDGKLYGPVADPLLKRWATEGRISATCQLLRPHWPRWCWASEVFPELAFPQGKAKAPSEQEAAQPTDPSQESDGLSMITVEPTSIMECYCRRFGIRKGVPSAVRVCSVVLQIYFVLNWLCWCGLCLCILAGIQTYPFGSLNRNAAVSGESVVAFLIVAIVLGSVVSWILFRIAQGLGKGQRAALIGLAVVHVLMLIAAVMCLATPAYLIGLVTLGTNLVLFLPPLVIAFANWGKFATVHGPEGRDTAI